MAYTVAAGDDCVASRARRAFSHSSQNGSPHCAALRRASDWAAVSTSSGKVLSEERITGAGTGTAAAALAHSSQKGTPSFAAAFIAWAVASASVPGDTAASAVSCGVSDWVAAAVAALDTAG